MRSCNFRSTMFLYIQKSPGNRKQEAGNSRSPSPFRPPPGGERTARGGISPVPCFPLPASARPTNNPRALEGPGVGIDRVCLVASDSQIIHQDVLAEDLDAVLEGGLVVRVLLVAIRDDHIVGLLVDLVLVHVAE